MRAIVIAVLIAIPGILACSPVASNDQDASTSSITMEKARQLAESAFLDYTSHEVTKYSIRPSVSTNEREWIFFVQGKDEFARPGFHWLVYVNKQSGATSIDPGQ
jgi:hypothetical protein